MAKRTYTNGEINVLWDSDLCTHCEACFKGLPQVFDPKARQWVNVHGAPADDVMDVVNECPSGAIKVDTV